MITSASPVYHWLPSLTGGKRPRFLLARGINTVSRPQWVSMEHAPYLTENTVWSRRARPLMNSKQKRSRPSRNGTDVPSLLSYFPRHTYKASPRSQRGTQASNHILIASCKFFWLPLKLTSTSLCFFFSFFFFFAAFLETWDLWRECRSHGKPLNFHEDKQDNGICSANWISRTVWLLAEVCRPSWFSRGNTNRCIFFPNNQSLLEW